MQIITLTSDEKYMIITKYACIFPQVMVSGA